MGPSSDIIHTEIKHHRYRCSVGRNGIGNKECEGDGFTPIGKFALRRVFYRADRIHEGIETSLPVIAITPHMGWCDDPDSDHYNQLVQLPIAVRHEEFWSEDEVYDIVVVVGYNDAPVVKGRGSAIFLHIARKNYSPTQGCIAYSKADLLAILKNLTPQSRIEISHNQIKICA